MRKRSLFHEAENSQAFLKMGLLGFQGSGKTYTATKVAIGVVELMRERKLPNADKPVYFIDTEQGADWVRLEFERASIPLLTAKTRAFKDLLTAIDDAQENASLLLIDSITHFWTDLMESFRLKLRRKRLQFQDWAVIKGEWRKFSDAFVNSQLHIILAGRAGFEYDYFETESGTKELAKTGIRMKAEGEFGYEPSLLVLMERHQDISSPDYKVWRTGTVLKDRSTLLDGMIFKNPKFSDFLPHVECLNLGGHQVGVDTTRDSQELFDESGATAWKRDKQRKEIALDEIQEVLTKHHGGQSKDAKTAKADLLEKHAKTRSWTRITETFNAEEVERVRNALWLELEGIEYNFTPPPTELDEDVA